MESSLAPGTEIGAYRIERLLGRGGMSTVYLAEDTGLKRDAQTGDLYRIDPDLERATTFALGTPLAAVAIDDAGDAVWVGTFAPD